MKHTRLTAISIAASAFACPAGIAESEQTPTANTQPPAGILAQSESAETQVSDKNTGSSDYLRSIIGLRLAPVPLKLDHKDRLLVGLGSYLVNEAMGCNDCHTNPSFAPGHDPYLGQPKQVNTEEDLGGGHPFPGDDGETVVPPDITPDVSGKPAGLSYREFYSGRPKRARSCESKPAAAGDAVAHISKI